MKVPSVHEPALPVYPESYWLASTSLPSFPKLTEDTQADAVIVGAGMTGITTAYLLAQKGLNVVLLETGELLSGTTKHTTAKITAQHDLIYSELIGHFGKEQARMYYEANQEALDFIKRIVKEQGIECQLTEEDAFVYTASEAEVRKVAAEYEAYEALRIPGTYTESIPLPYATKAAVVMPEQAQFHPAAFLKHMVSEITRLGGRIFEKTTASDVVEQGNKLELSTADGYHVTADYAVSCSHLPFVDGGGFYFTRLHAERSYALLCSTEKVYPGGMYLSSEEPKRSLRSVNVDGETMVLIGGEGHKTGQGVCTFQYYEALQRFGEDTFGLKDIRYRWSAQDLISLDKVPYIGPITADKPNLLVATGYKKWGMTTSIAAALLNSRRIIGEDCRYSDLFSPSRFHADPDIKTFVVQNADVAGHFFAGKLDLTYKKLDDVGDDEGAVVRIQGKRTGAYRDSKGELYLVDTTCTHMGCEVEWNAAERSWDCPCHGSRFSYRGDVIEGPAERPLSPVQV